MEELKLAHGTGSSVVVSKCQICGSTDLKSGLFLGYLPPVNQMRTIGEKPHEEAAYPAELLYCDKCGLAQLGLIVDSKVLFPPEYPYTSGTTKILRENFAELSEECSKIVPFAAEDLIVDIGSNDGTLLSNFKNKGFRVLGIEPTLMAGLANERGITTNQSFFGRDAASEALKTHGKAKIITATNVFAHIENVHEIVEGVLDLLDHDGVFITESHYLKSLVETLQYDTIYHEHLRYYSLRSLRNLLDSHGLEIIHAKKIPTHGGSIRVYAVRKGVYPVRDTFKTLLSEETLYGLNAARFEKFRKDVALSKLKLHALISSIREEGKRIYGIGAPSRASTLIHYVGLESNIVDCVLEVKGSYKTGKYMPGTLIPVLEESKLYEDGAEYALLFSWHIADELMPKIRAKGFRGKFIIPLPEPRIV